MNFKRESIIFSMLIFLFSSCKGQLHSNEECVERYKSAKNVYSSYYINNDQKKLSESLSDLDYAINCETTRSKSLNLKISVLMLLKDYKRGYQFIDSLKTSDFKFEYQKKMTYNYFAAMKYEANGDSLNKNKLYYETISVIENYLKNKNDVKINEEIYYELFLTKSRVISQKQIDKEIDFLKLKYPQSAAFFTVLQSSLYEEVKIGFAHPN